MLKKTEEEIKSNWKSQKVRVSISCIAYNQANYISQTLDSFLSQNTSFAFEVLVHDDCSTDGTDKLIDQYAKLFPNIIKPMFESENQYKLGKGGSIEWNFPRAKGDYLAMCEGDDYWSDPNKLQLQFDFLESNKEYGMIYTRAKKYIQSSGTFASYSFGEEFNGFDDLLLNGNRIPTLTVMFRKQIIDEYLEFAKSEINKWMMGDYPMWLFVARKSNVKFLNQETGVYRVLDNSASHSTSFEKIEKFVKSTYDIKKYFIDRFNLKLDLDSDKNLSLALYAYKYGNNKKGKEYLSKVTIYRNIKSRIKGLILKIYLFRKLYLKTLEK